MTADMPKRRTRRQVAPAEPHEVVDRASATVLAGHEWDCIDVNGARVWRLIDMQARVVGVLVADTVAWNAMALDEDGDFASIGHFADVDAGRAAVEHAGSSGQKRRSRRPAPTVPHLTPVPPQAT